MKTIGKTVFLTLALLFLATQVHAADSNIARSENIEAQLVTDVNAIQPGEKITIALRMKMDPHWHTYWRNVGDSGLPVEIAWALPDGFSAAEIQWPYPERIVAEPLVSFGYHGEIFLLNEITVPDEIGAESVTIEARADWLECADVCIPGGVDLTMTLPVTDQPQEPDEKWVEAFAETRSKLPLEESGWSFAAQRGEEHYTLKARAPEWYENEPGKVLYFPYESGIIDYAAAQQVSFENGVLTLKAKISQMPAEGTPNLEGVLVAENGWRGPGSEKALYYNGELGSDVGETAGAASESSLLLILLGAFVGGMILNLMPCVLPVLSLKIMGFVQQANEENSKPWKHGLVFTLGVWISFLVLAGVLLALRAGGEELGWGFQLQSPVFLIVLSAFLFLFGLSMFGVFEIGTSLTTMQGKQKSSGFGGSFVSGVTATVVATPCTAPFMGSALGFALTQPAWISLTVFSFLGLGMAFPYVLLASTPALLKFVPKPGRWMESLKQFMGFLLLATVLWLLWVLAQQAGAMMVIVTLGALLLLGVAGWIYGRWGNLAMAGRTRAVATTVAAVITIAAIYINIDSVDTFAATPTAAASGKSSEGINWEGYSDSRYEELKNSNQPVFIDFTAAWCLSCQVNDRVAFSSQEVQQKFKDLGIVPIKADWTSRDETITRALARYGRNSVPLYVYYPAGTASEPQILPEIITPGIVLNALDKTSQQTLTRK